jgi:hypothetical protein
MSVKFKIGFQIDAETLFGIIAKFLPLEELEIEEIASKPTHAERSIAVHKLTVAAPKPKRQFRQRANPGPDLKRGINGIIMSELSTGPKHTINLRPKIQAASYSPNSTNSRLEELRKFGVIDRDDDGRWKIKRAE